MSHLCENLHHQKFPAIRYHSTTDHGINIQYYLWLALYLHTTVVLGIQKVYTELGFMYLKTFWKLRNRISAGTVKTMKGLGACYSVNEDGYQASVNGQ